MADDELDLNHDGIATGDASFGVRKDIALKLKPSPSKGKRGRKSSKHKKDEAREDSSKHVQDEADEEVQLPTMKGPSEPQHKNKKLRWDHKVHLIGEKVLDPLIHCCENCALPILLYGRMIPCKHVFCYDCAMKSDKKCARCHDEVQRVEQAALGTVFVCTHGGAKHGVSGCRRTYLSNRDLQAHIRYRHLREQPQTSTAAVSQPQTAVMQRQEYPPVQTSAMVNLPPPQLSNPQQVSPASRTPGLYPDSQGMMGQGAPLSLPQTFTSPPPPVGQTLGPPSQSFSQPPPPSSLESYHSLGGAMAGGAMAGGIQRPGNLIPIAIQDYNPAQSLSQPPPTYPPPPLNVPPRGYPPVSYAPGTVSGAPMSRPGLPPGHLPPRQGPPPRFPPGQTPPYNNPPPHNNPPQQSGGPWQAPGGPPPRGPPPSHPSHGPGPPRY